MENTLDGQRKVQGMAKKTKKSKSKYIGMMDQSSFHFEGGAELEITKDTLKRLQRLNGSPWIQGNIGIKSSFKIMLGSGREDNTPIEFGDYYIMDKGNSKISLKVTGNPSKIMTGTNAIPCRASLKEAEKYGHNDHTRTFGFGLRLPFLLLEHVPMINRDERGFRWSDEERRTIDRGDFTISQLQLAFYSAGFASRDDRNIAMRLIVGLYMGDTLLPVNWDVRDKRIEDKNGRTKLGDYLNIGGTTHGNLNITLSPRHGQHKLLSVTLYAKESAPNYTSNKESVTDVLTDDLSHRIRFDVTLLPRFLMTMRTSGDRSALSCRELEDFYMSECENGGGYDKGFYTWFVEEIDRKLNLTYLLSNLGSVYRDKLDAVDAYLNDPDPVNEQRKKEGLMKLKKKHYAILKKWYNTDAIYVRASELCEKSLAEGDEVIDAGSIAARLVKEAGDAFGLDLTIPQIYLSKANMNGVVNVQTGKEIRDTVKSSFQTNMSLPKWLDEKFERIDFAAAGISDVLRRSRGENFRVSKTVAPTTIKRFEDLYAIKCFENRPSTDTRHDDL